MKVLSQRWFQAGLEKQILFEYGLFLVFFFQSSKQRFIFISCVVEWRTANLCSVGQDAALFISFRLPAAFLTQGPGRVFFFLTKRYEKVGVSG